MATQTTVIVPKGYKIPEKEIGLILSANGLSLDICFHVIQSEQITLSTDITDHIVEDHTVVQDHITVKPRTFTMRGLISEKVYIHPDAILLDKPKEPVKAKLAKLGILAPTLSSYVSSAINAITSVANKVNNIRNKALNAFEAGTDMLIDKFLSSFGLERKIEVDLTHKRWSDKFLQKNIIEILDKCRKNRIPIKVNTGWGIILENFYITDITVNQGDTYQLSDLSVTVKELRFTDTRSVKLTNEDATRFSQQAATWENIVTGQQQESWLHKTFLPEK